MRKQNAGERDQGDRDGNKRAAALLLMNPSMIHGSAPAAGSVDDRKDAKMP